MSTALYRRYRSATFADLIGQEHVARTLRNEVRDQSLAHAYLFSGIRGTGKTSTARILARAVNCPEQQGGEPCNRCDACLEITSGAAVDVLEIDAASNRGIDEMRDLREKVKYLPASLRRKVYIIDEAHMLTTEAWNAFLKTLEEPPPHVLFVLATTEPHKVPETVRSRVQRFDFRRVSAADIVGHIESIGRLEGATIEPAAAGLLARAAQGSVRDALSLLDQALAGGERTVVVDTVRRALGLAGPGTVRAITVAVVGIDPAAALRAAAVAFDAGVDARQLLRELAQMMRGSALAAVGYPEGVDLDPGDVELCRELAGVAPERFWVDALEVVGNAEVALRQPVDARMQVELCLLRLSQLARPERDAAGLAALEVRVAELESRPVNGAGRAVTALQPPPRDSPAQHSAVAAPPPSSPPPSVVPEETLGAVESPPSPVGGVAGVKAWTASWALLVEAVNRRDAMLAGVLRDCRPADAGPSGLVIGAPYGFHLERLRDPAKAGVLADAVAEVAGGARTVEAVFAADMAVAPASGDGAGDLTHAALEAFPGSRLTGTRLRDDSIHRSARADRRPRVD